MTEGLKRVEKCGVVVEKIPEEDVFPTTLDALCRMQRLRTAWKEQALNLFIPYYLYIFEFMPPVTPQVGYI